MTVPYSVAGPSANRGPAGALTGRAGKSIEVHWPTMKGPEEPRTFPDPDQPRGQDILNARSRGDSQDDASAPQDLPGWLDLVRQLRPEGVWLDLGGADNSPLGQAARRAYHAFGCDIGSLAPTPRRSPDTPLVRAEPDRLPFADAAADIATLSQVLERLSDPLSLLQETARVLKPGGLLLGATSDPLFFPGDQQNHRCARPPSFWIRALEQLGFTVTFRFSGHPDNFQFLGRYRAGAGAATAILQPGDFGREPDFCRSQGPLEVAPRRGWGPLLEGKRRLQQQPASLYLLNRGRAPCRVRARLRVSHGGVFTNLKLRFNSLILAQLALDSERLQHRLELPPWTVPAGGHHLFFELEPADVPVAISAVELRAETSTPTELIQSLPFDLYQRYQLASEMAALLGPQRVLDVGGLLGDRDGHLATTRDFFPRPEQVLTTDLRPADHPSHRPAAAWKQPFADKAFDLVLSLDVLEHLAADRRPAFMAELDRLARHWILLGAPFADPAVEAAEQALADSVMAARPFLLEHRRLGLPEAGEVENFFAVERGYSLVGLPNGELSRWSAMQALTQLVFALGTASTWQDFNRCYNRHGYRFDQRKPAYRTLWLVSKQPLSREQRAGLQRLKGDPEGNHRLESALLSRAEWLRQLQSILDSLQAGQSQNAALRFLLNERQKLIDLLEGELQRRRQVERTSLWRWVKNRLQKRFQS